MAPEAERADAGPESLQEAIRQHRQGNWGLAEQLYRNVLSGRPDDVEALHAYGVLALQSRRPQLSADLIRKAIGLAPSVPRYQNNLGAALLQAGRVAEAVAAFRQAVTLDTAYADARHNLALALLQLERFDEAAEHCRELIRRDPAHHEAHLLLGNALRHLGHPEEALASCETALRLKPDFAEAHSNRGNALQDLNRLDEALASYDAALRLKPDLAEALSSRGSVLQDQGRLDEALAAYALSLRFKPDDAKARFNNAIALLLTGHFRDGWQDHEWRWRGGSSNTDSPRHQSVPQWRGDPANGRTILLWHEQGLGDTLQFVRYAPLLARMGWNVVVEVQPSLAPLLRPMAGVQVVVDGAPLPPFQVQSPLLSLPLAFATTLDTIPAEIPYLAVGSDFLMKWRNRLPQDGLRVGIAWQGNPNHRNDKNRSIPLSHFIALANVPGVRLISLQKKYGLEQLTELPPGCTIETLGPAYDTGDFRDTAAIISRLDLVICADTSVAHLAGALGRPAWVALPFAPDWRWMTNREDSPWYPTMRLFRQSTPGDWLGVFQKIGRELARLERG